MFFLHDCPCTICVQCLRKSEEGVKFPEAGITDSHKPNRLMSAGTQHIFSNKYSPWKLKLNHMRTIQVTNCLKIHSPWEAMTHVSIDVATLFSYTVLARINKPNCNDLFSKMEVTKISFWLVLTSRSRLTMFSETKRFHCFFPGFYGPIKHL